MIIFDTPEKDLSNFDGKFDIRKICTSSVKSSSTLFSCSVRAIYNRVNRDQKKILVLKSYIPGINSLVSPKIHYENFPSDNLVN